MPLSSAGSAGNREGGRGGCEQVNTHTGTHMAVSRCLGHRQWCTWTPTLKSSTETGEFSAQTLSCARGTSQTRMLTSELLDQVTVVCKPYLSV